MDLAIVEETILNDRDYTWIASDPSWVLGRTQPRTVILTAFTKAVHYPNGFLKRGLVLAKYTSGANAGYWGPFISDNAEGEGLATPAGIVVTGFKVSYKNDATLESNVVAGAVVLAKVPIEIYRLKLPKLVLDDGTTEYTVTAANVTTLGFVDATP